MNLARDLYQADLAKAKTAEEKPALARNLLAEAKAAKSVDVSTLVLLRLARDTAVGASDVATAFAAIDAMAARYRIECGGNEAGDVFHLCPDGTDARPASRPGRAGAAAAGRTGGRGSLGTGRRDGPPGGN